MAKSSPPLSGNEHYQHAPDQTELEKVLHKGLTAIEPYSNVILIACLAVTIVSVGVIVWYRNAQTQQLVGWDEFTVSRAPEDFIVLADKYPAAPVGAWARLEAGRLFLNEGLAQALTNRQSSDDRLQKAKEAYDKLLQPGQPAEIREAALYGMATCLEALSNGDTDPAIAAYEQLLQEFPDSQHRLWAEERVSALKNKDSSAFYAWFRTQNPKPADRPGPRDVSSAPGGEAQIPDLKDLPDLKMPAGQPGELSATPGSTVPPVPELPLPLKEAPRAFPEKGEKPAAPPGESKPPELPPTPKSETKPAEPSSPPAAEPPKSPAPAPEKTEPPTSPAAGKEQP